MKDCYTFCASIYVKPKEGKPIDRKRISGFPALRIGIIIDYKGAKKKLSVVIEMLSN